MIAAFAADPQTLVFAPVVGAYLIVSAVGLLRQGVVAAFFDDLIRHPGSLHAVGAVAFLSGVAILSLHRHWSHPAEVALNLVAAYWAFEGAGMLASPDAVGRALARPGTVAAMKAITALLMIVGIYLVAIAIIARRA